MVEISNLRFALFFPPPLPPPPPLFLSALTRTAQAGVLGSYVLEELGNELVLDARNSSGSHSAEKGLALKRSLGRKSPSVTCGLRLPLVTTSKPLTSTFLFSVNMKRGSKSRTRAGPALLSLTALTGAGPFLQNRAWCPGLPHLKHSLSPGASMGSLHSRVL